MVFYLKLTYKFNNDEKKLNVEKKEYLIPNNVEVFFREGDSIYVDTNDYVYVNQLLIESPTGIKTYATVSGTVERKQDSLVITNDKTDSTMNSEDALSSIEDVKKDEIISVCQNLGISFENRLIVNKLKTNSKVLVVNGMDIEPYQLNNNYLFQDNVKNLLETINLLSRRFNLDAYLLLNKYDDNNVYAVKTLIGSYPNINFIVVNDVFPYNTNGVIAKKYFNEYKLEEILFLDTVSLYKIFVALKDKLPVSQRYITVVLDDPTKVYVINTKYGANLKEVIKDTVNLEFENRDVFLNNFMRKVKCSNIEALTVTDNIKSIFIFEKDDNTPSKCIKCGKCVDICPMGLNPLSKKLDSTCIRCGLCNFVCPANRNLISREKEEV